MQRYKIDQYFEIHFNTQRFDTGAASDADSTPTYRVYEENNDTVIDSGNCSKVDDANTTGYYKARAQITSAAGYEVGKVYYIRVEATVNSVSGAAVVGKFTVVPSTVYDALVAGTDYLQTDLLQILGTALTETSSGYLAAAFKKLFDVSSPVLTAESVNQTGDAYARLGAPTGASVSADIADVESKVDDLEGRLTATRAGYLDNLSGGAVALETTAQAIKTKTDNLPTDPADQSAVEAAIDSAVSAMQGTDGDTLKTLSDQIDGLNDTTVALEGRLTATRAGYLDNLSGGAVALETTAQAIKTKTDNLPTDPADQSAVEAAIDSAVSAINSAISAMQGTDGDTLKTLSDQIDGLNDITVADIIAGVTDGSLDLQEILRIILAAVAGKVVGAGTTTVSFRDPTDAKNRIVAICDKYGNRSVILDAS